MWMPGFHLDSFQGTGIEDETETFVEYYGLQSVSFRNAIYHLFDADEPGFLRSQISCGNVHPTYLGHR